nr:PREDICTED: ankyrin repeat and SAM domain-containing protein 1A [Bemisia tabaci]
MGKDQELLEASRNGNFPVVEKILASKAKRSGPLASLRRGPGANVQDASGYSCLHHAALNGHADIVELLLTHEASPNIVDNKGSSPIHLAAWSGNLEIVRLLLCHGPSVPNVNLTTQDNETALHCAAQYGHTSVVNILLEHNCDPTIRNTRQETALDLAAQYGRLEAVELLVRTHPELVQAYNSKTANSIFPHTPLHLASRNGHKAVVETLLAAGLDVNVRTAAGTALHEAALCGKLEVARTLLEHGVDLAIKDARKCTVVDVLKQFPTHVVQDITTIIRRYRRQTGSDMSDNDDALPPIPVPDLGSPYENVGASPSHWDLLGSRERRIFNTSAISINSEGSRQRHATTSTTGLSKSLMESSFLSDDPSCCRSHDYDTMSISSTASSNCGGGGGGRGERRLPDGNYLPMTPSPASQQLPSPSAGSNSKISPTPPKKPPRRNLSVSPTHFTPQAMSVPAEPPGSYEYLFLARSGVRSHSDLEDLQPTNGKPGKWSKENLRRGKSQENYADTKLRHSVPIPTGEERNGHAAPLMTRGQSEDSQLNADRHEPIALTSVYENVAYRTTNPRRKLRRHNAADRDATPDPSVILSRGDLPFRKVETAEPTYPSVTIERILVPSCDKNKSNSESIDLSVPSFISNAFIKFKSKEQMVNGCSKPRNGEKTWPLSPTHYQQPPTPDHPPPTPSQAEKSIHERIRPLSQEYSALKRKSRDMETETEEELLVLVFPGPVATMPPMMVSANHNNTHVSTASLSSSVSDKSVSTDTNAVEEFIGDVPFAGLFKGSVGGSKAERPKTLRKLRNVYDPSLGMGEAPKKEEKHTTAADSNSNSSTTGTSNADKTLSILSPFDEQEEWAKISEIMASFGTGIVRESVFVDELEKEFKARLGLRKSESVMAESPVATSSVSQWLESIGFPQYESQFMEYGYDNIDFINGVITENDLKELGVNEQDVEPILKSASTLPNRAKEVYDRLHNNNTIYKNNNNSTTTNNNDDDKHNANEESVGDWLKEIGLECHAETFRRHLYAEMSRVRRIWEVELTAVLEIPKPGHRRRILASVNLNSAQNSQLLNTKTTAASRKSSPVNSLKDLDSDLKQLKSNIQQLKEDIKSKLPQATNPNPGATNNTGGSNTGTLHRHKKSRPAPPPPPPPHAAPVQNDLEIRNPSELLIGVPPTLTTQWRHKPEALVTGTINYLASYLGSTVVKELRGTESTKKSIQKLKKSAGNDVTVPQIVLAISYRGVKFLDPMDQALVCEHEIRNIHCACQDAEELTHFAYITKDHASNAHYCHVFCVSSMDQATEVILTLGQAFEVAYQIALKDQINDTSMKTNGHTRSRSVNQIVSNNHIEISNCNSQSATLNLNHSRSHSVNVTLVNGNSHALHENKFSTMASPKQLVANDG